MTTNSIRIDYVKALHLKRVGLALAGLWVIIFIAAVSATIYREFDGPTVRSTVAENLNLTATNSTLSANLESARKANEVAVGTIDQLNADLMVSQSEHANLERWLESYLSFAPLTQIGTTSAATLDLLFLP